MAHPEPTGRTAPAAFLALADPAFRRLWASSWCYYAARMAELATLLWFVSETEGPLRVTLVGAFRTAPMFLLGLVAGSLADRFPRRRMLQSAQTTTASLATGMALVFFFSDPPFWYAYVVIFISGMAWTIDFASRRSLLAEWFVGRRLVNAISLDSAVLTGSNMLGPLIAGVAIFLFGFSGAYVVIATLYGIGTLFILSIRGVAPVQATASAAPRVSQVAALKTMRRNTTVWSVLMVTVALNLFGFPYLQMVPVIGREVLDTNSVLYGVLASAIGIGAISSSLLIGTGRFRRYGTVFSLGALLMVMSIFWFAWSELYLLSVLLLMTAGMGMAAFSILQPVIILEAVAPHTRGRAMGAISLAIGVNPLGLIVMGLIAEQAGPQVALASIAAAGVLTIAALRLRYPTLRDRQSAEEQPAPQAP